MSLKEDPIAIISSACRLPLGITSPSQLWDVFCGRVDSKDVFTSLDSVPKSRHSDPRAFIDPKRVGGAGWLSTEGVEAFDPAFFNISPAEAEVLRPNTRLALELTWEALERAGIPPGSLRGKNVAVSIGVGTEDGWDLRRYSDDRSQAFDHRWAANSDPSGVSGQVAYYFDFRGPSSVISTACSSGAFALRDGIQALLHEDCELAVVGAVTTHFFTAPFDWAASVNVASKKGQCAAFSSEADGYVPSEGAVCFVLKKASVARADGNPVLGCIRSLSTGHNGSTRALATPNVSAQIALTHRSLRVAGLLPSDINILEAHGTGTRLGDAIEAEAFRTVYDADEERLGPLWVSSSKTLFGHCQAASTLVGMLKVLACFEHKALPPHLVDPLPEFKQGKILIPPSMTTLKSDRLLIAQICSFGFTGSIASLILEEVPQISLAVDDVIVNATDARLCMLPFSAKTTSALNAQIVAVYDWACKTKCSLYDLGAILSLARDHHPVRLGVIASNINDLQGVYSETYSPQFDDLPAEDIPSASAFLNLSELPHSISDEERKAVDELLDAKQVLRAACLLYKKGHRLHFDEVYDLRKVTQLRQHLQTFPTYVFDRKICWKDVRSSVIQATPTWLTRTTTQEEERQPGKVLKTLSIHFIRGTVAAVLQIPVEDVQDDSNVFDLGIDSLNSIELANTLSQASGISLPVMELYSLQSIQAIGHFFQEKTQGRGRTEITSQSRFSQEDVNSWVAEYGTLLDTRLAPETKKERSENGVAVLLTGGNGMLGCHVLHDLLLRPEVAQIFCPVRGDAWVRLSQAFASHGHDDAHLVRERDVGKLIVFHISDLGDDYLGCGPDMYRQLTQSINSIVHLAWKLDFNLPASAFQKCVQGTRNLAQLCIAADEHVDYYFISSFSAYFGYGDTLIPEKQLDADLSACLDQGYAVSKLIAEHALFSMHRASSDAFTLHIVRVGQICGNSVTGDWSLNEMIPMMIKSLPTLRILPRNLPDVSWIPSDICAAAIADFVVSPSAASDQQVLHVANPQITPWPAASDLLAKLAGLGGVSLVALRDYVDAVQNAATRTELAISRLLPYFLGVVERGDLPSKYASLEVKESIMHSPALSACPAINEDFLRPIVTYLLMTHLDFTESQPSRSLEPPVLLFGPWSEAVSSSMTVSEEVREQVEITALQVRKEIHYDDENQPLNFQLATLVGQVSAYEGLKRRAIAPRAVLGYCFGEYAASVCAGIMSLESAVEIIVRRAAALHDVKGSMLNVFAELIAVKRQLLKLPFDMEIAIHAGPNHYVLSGQPEHISFVQSSFQKAGVKTKLVETSIPFHSAVMDNMITTLKLPSVDCNAGSCTYISGLTGSSIGGKMLGPKYWLRHMRDPVLFLDAVRYIQKHYPSSPLIDIGPGRMLSSIISRYKWEDFQIFTLEKFLSADFSQAFKPDTRPALPSQTIVTSSRLPATLSTQPSAGTNETGQKLGRDKIEAAVADILISGFGYKGSESRSLLSKSFLMLGLQSLDFVTFSEKVLATTGVALPASSFASDLPLSGILAPFLS